MNYFPTSLSQAAAYSDAAFAGGCTDLMPLFKNQVRDDANLIFLSQIPSLRDIREDGDRISVGAAAILTDVAESALILSRLPALAQAAAAVASVQIRNIATMGGNIMQDRRCIYFNQSAMWRSALPACFKTGGGVCHQIPNSPVCRAIYYSDIATALLIYDAQAEYWENGALQCAPLQELLHRHCQANGLACRNHLKVLITRFLIDKPLRGERSGFYKYAMRTSIDFPLINFALRCGGPRPPKLVSGAVAPEPVVLEKTAALLENSMADDEILAACQAELKSLALPIVEACISPARKRDLYAQLFPLLSLRKECPETPKP
ncbi:xanthine dehydrogenase family protein subunit M [uncultured Oscillibacter sp.]|uniref:FAD binding domain-containing protein n=1 Tax=uncultured Oscillibacter sp. TaxID=876091 RepID=UPI0025EDB8AD|nr:FAD binding domain-containing protein [uncultured Oscillibacter sp.]